MKKRPVVLVILDGWGMNHNENELDGVRLSNPINFNRYKKEYPYTELRADGEFVGLPEGQFGNSEVGHLNIGAGRVVYQLLPLITKEIREGKVLENKALVDVMDKTIENNGALHIMGLMSDGGVHADIHHMIGLVDMAKKKGLEKVFIHAIMDGRDTAPKSGAGYLETLEKGLAEVGIGRVSTVVGRYYAMDRDNNWDRIEKAYDAIILGEAEENVGTSAEAIENSYENDITDEFVKATKVGGKIKVEDGDGMIFANFRPDRARQLTRAIISDESFTEFDRKATPKVNFVTMAQYDSTFDVPVAYPPQTIVNGFGEVVSKAGLTQVRTAETEKYAHVTFFFNGGVEEPYPGEIRLLSDSPKVPTYDMQPEMSAYDVKNKLIEELNTGKVDTVILNFANPDMVGHTGNLDAVMIACQAVDNCTAQIVNKVLELDGAVIITADHGNADLLQDPETGEPYTAHTTNPVPCILISNDLKDVKLREDGKLADLTPTMLDLLGVEKPVEMDGETLIIK